MHSRYASNTGLFTWIFLLFLVSVFLSDFVARPAIGPRARIYRRYIVQQLYVIFILSAVNVCNHSSDTLREFVHRLRSQFLFQPRGRREVSLKLRCDIEGTSKSVKHSKQRKMNPIKFCSILAVMLGATSFLVVVEASRKVSKFLNSASTWLSA